MNIPYEIKNDKNNIEHINIPLSYQDNNIEIKIYTYVIIVCGIDEQIMFKLHESLDLYNTNITFKEFKNSTNILLDNIINIKHVKNKVFFKLYQNEKLSKKAFCYLDKENKKIYENSAYIFIKYLFNHKYSEQYHFTKISDTSVYISNIENQETFIISLFNKDIVKIEHSFNENEYIYYTYTNNLLYYINNLNIFDFGKGIYEVDQKEIEKIKLSKKINQF